MLQEYVVPEITKDDFCRRIGAVLGNRSLDRVSEVQQQHSVTGNTNRTPSTSAALPTPAPATSSPLQQPQPATQITHVIPETAESQHSGQMQAETQPAENVQASQDGTITLKPSLESKKDTPKKTRPKQNTSSFKKIDVIQGRKEVRTSPASPAIDKPVGKSTSESPEEQVNQTPAPQAPPSKYRLQVRLFDGTSVRSSFSPSHTIRGDVRPWLDDQLPDKTQPYNLKHILTPLPNYTLSVMDEEKTLQELSLGPTANLVMISIQSYANAYAPSALSLPVRGARTLYGLASSTVGGLMDLASSFYGSPSVPSENASSRNTGSESPSGDEVRRAGQPTTSQRPRIRTLRDQRDNERSDNEFYNGNQVCRWIEPIIVRFHAVLITLVPCVAQLRAAKGLTQTNFNLSLHKTLKRLVMDMGYFQVF